MTAAEYAGWCNHILRFPPGDYHLQRICADIAAMLYSFMAQKPASPFDFAPHLESLEIRIERARQKRKQKIQEVGGIMKSALDEVRKSGKLSKLKLDA